MKRTPTRHDILKLANLPSGDEAAAVSTMFLIFGHKVRLRYFPGSPQEPLHEQGSRIICENGVGEFRIEPIEEVATSLPRLAACR